jgi:hypothetical protein
MDTTQPPRHEANPNPCLPDLIHHQQDSKLSIKYRKQSRQDLDTSIGTAPAYATRQRDGVFYPSPKTFTDAYKVIEIGSMLNKTRETSFQILNRTVWTNRKAFRSRLADSASCDRCEEEETMEHLLYGCENYSAVVWREFSTLITTKLAHIAGHPVARMDHTPPPLSPGPGLTRATGAGGVLHPLYPPPRSPPPHPQQSLYGIIFCS